jgi:hypothetical protein
MTYLYDGSFAGFLCCIFQSYAKHEIPTAIFSDEDSTPLLFANRTIPTDAGQAGRVYRKMCDSFLREKRRHIKAAPLGVLTPGSC